MSADDGRGAMEEASDGALISASYDGGKPTPGFGNTRARGISEYLRRAR